MSKNYKILLILFIVLAIIVFIIFKRKKINSSLLSTNNIIGQQMGIKPTIINYLGGQGFLTNYPRGIRNNNPGNLRITSITWQGKVAKENNTDGSFEQFINFSYGLRAMIKDLTSKIKSGTNTISKIIPIYAPGSDNNNEQAYISSVVNTTGIAANSILNTDKETLYLLTKAFTMVENGNDYITEDIFNNAWEIL